MKTVQIDRLKELNYTDDIIQKLGYVMDDKQWVDQCFDDLKLVFFQKTSFSPYDRKYQRRAIRETLSNMVELRGKLELLINTLK